MYYDTMDWIIGAVIALMVAFLALMLGATLIDGVQGYRSYPARVACESKQMAPRRRDFSATVTCVPVPMRRDTLSIEGLPR